MKSAGISRVEICSLNVIIPSLYRRVADYCHLCYIYSMKWRIKQKKQKDGSVWYIPQYKYFLFWHKITVMEHFRWIYVPLQDDYHKYGINHHYDLKAPFDGYTYLLSKEDARKTIELYRTVGNPTGSIGFLYREITRWLMI